MDGDGNLKKLRDISKDLRTQNTENLKSTRSLVSATGELVNMIAEGVQGYRDYNSGIKQTLNLFTRVADLGKTRFKEIGNQINITTGVTQDLVGIMGEAVSAASENFELNSNIEESTKAVKRNLLENESVRSRINEAAKLEYENQERYITSLDIAYNKKLKEVKLKENEFATQQNLVNSLQNDIDLTAELLNLSTSQADKTYYSNVLARQRVELEEATIDAKEKQLDLDAAAASATAVLAQKQGALQNGYKSVEDAQHRITGAIVQATDETVKLSIQYKQFGNYVSEIADAQTASGNVLQKFNRMVAEESRKEFEDSYAKKLKGTRDISKISKDEYELQFRKNSLEKALTDASKLREQVLNRIAAQGGVKTKLDEEELRIAEDIVAQSKIQLDGLDKSIEKLAKIESYEKRIHHEKEKQNIATEASKSISEKLTGILGDSGDEILEIGKAFKESMISPLALIGALIGNALEEFMKLGQANKAFMDTSKLNASQIQHLSALAHDLSLEYRAHGLMHKDVLDAAGSIVSEYGTMNQATDIAVEKVALMGKAFGVSSDNAAKTIAQLQRSTGLSAESAGNIAALGANFAKAAGVAPDVVMQDIANSSEEIAKYFSGTPEDLFKTAVEARRLGMDLKEVAKISERLLDFESSIENQMTASVLLGKEINLDKARQLALEGDIMGAAEETLKQVGSLSDFNKMNAVQKQAIADAAGMSVGELQKSLQAQEALSKMTAKDRAEYEKGLKALDASNEITGEKLLKEQRNQLTQQKIADAVAKISDIFANVILPVLDPIFNLITGIFNVIEPILPLLKTGLQIFIGWKALMFAISKIRLIDFKALKSGLTGLFTGDTWKKGFGLIRTGWSKLTTYIKTDWKKAMGTLEVPDMNIGKKTAALRETYKPIQPTYKEFREKGLSPADALSAARKKLDTAQTGLNTKALSLNNSQLKVYKSLRQSGIPPTNALAAARAMDTANTISNSNAQKANSGIFNSLKKNFNSVIQSIKGLVSSRKLENGVVDVSNIKQKSSIKILDSLRISTQRLRESIKNLLTSKKLDSSIIEENNNKQKSNIKLIDSLKNSVSKLRDNIKSLIGFKKIDNQLIDAGNVQQKTNTKLVDSIRLSVTKYVGTIKNFLSLQRLKNITVDLQNTKLKNLSKTFDSIRNSFSKYFIAIKNSIPVKKLENALTDLSAFKQKNLIKVTDSLKNSLTEIGIRFKALIGFKRSDNNITDLNTVKQKSNFKAIESVRNSISRLGTGIKNLLTFKKLDNTLTDSGASKQRMGATLIDGVRSSINKVIVSFKGLIGIKKVDNALTDSSINKQRIFTRIFDGLKKSVSSFGTIFKNLFKSRTADTVATTSNTLAQIKNSIANSKVVKTLGSVLTALQRVFTFKKLDTTITRSNTLEQIKNSSAVSKVIRVISSLFAPIQRLISARKLDTMSMTSNILKQKDSVKSTGLVQTALVKLKNTFGIVKTAISSFFSMSSGKLREWSKSYTTSLDGLNNKSKNILGKLGDRFNNVFKKKPTIPGSTEMKAPMGGTMPSMPAGANKPGPSDQLNKLSKTGAPSLLKTAAAIIVISGALFIAAKAFQQFASVPWSSVGKGITVLGALSLAAVLLGKVKGQIIMGAVAIGVLGLALLPAAKAFSMLEKVNPKTIISFSIAVGALAVVATLLGKVVPFLLAGSIGIAALGFALRPLAKTFADMKSLDPDKLLLFGKAIAGFAIMTAGLGAISGLILVGSAALGILGLALKPLGEILNKVGTPLKIVSESLKSLVSTIKGNELTTIGAGLLSISKGLAAVGLSGILALPALMGLAKIAPVLKTVAGIFGGDGETPKPVTTAPAAGTTTATGTAATGTTPAPNMTELLAKIDALISAVNKQPIQLVVNGKVMAEVVGRNTSRSGAVSNK